MTRAGRGGAGGGRASRGAPGRESSVRVAAAERERGSSRASQESSSIRAAVRGAAEHRSSSAGEQQQHHHHHQRQHHQHHQSSTTRAQSSRSAGQPQSSSAAEQQRSSRAERSSCAEQQYRAGQQQSLCSQSCTTGQRRQASDGRRGRCQATAAGNTVRAHVEAVHPRQSTELCTPASLCSHPALACKAVFHRRRRVLSKRRCHISSAAPAVARAGYRRHLATRTLLPAPSWPCKPTAAKACAGDRQSSLEAQVTKPSSRLGQRLPTGPGRSSMVCACALDCQVGQVSRARARVTVDHC